MKKLLLIGMLAAAAASQAVLSYDNLDAPSAAAGGTSDALWGTSSAIFGDQVSLTTGGSLNSFKHTIFNSTTGGNTGNLLTANVEVKFYNLGSGTYTGGALTAPLLGTFSGNVNFGTGLNAGFFSTITWTGLSAIVLPATNVMITTQVTSFTGTTNRLGAVMFTTDNVGSSIGTANSIYRKNSTTEGLLTFAAPNGKLGYQVDVNPVPEPATMAALGLGFAAIARRRRAAKK